jgi:hypothetical protein
MRRGLCARNCSRAARPAFPSAIRRLGFAAACRTAVKLPDGSRHHLPPRHGSGAQGLPGSFGKKAAANGRSVRRRADRLLAVPIDPNQLGRRSGGDTRHKLDNQGSLGVKRHAKSIACSALNRAGFAGGFLV